MGDHLLIVGSDSAWLQAMRFLEDPAGYDSTAEAEGLPPHVTACPDNATALAELDKDAGDPIIAAIIFGFHASPTTSIEKAACGCGARDLAIDLHARRRTLPVLFATQVRLDVLERFAASTENVERVGAGSVLETAGALRRSPSLRLLLKSHHASGLGGAWIPARGDLPALRDQARDRPYTRTARKNVAREHALVGA